MKNLNFRSRIKYMNVLILIPVLAAFAIASYGISYSFVLRNQVRVLTRESYQSQIYLKDRLGVYAEPRLQARELAELAASLCNLLADDDGMRVQVFTPELLLLGDSDLPDNVMPLTADVESASRGTKSYQFFLRDTHLYLSFSSPVYVGGQCLGVIRYLDRQASFSWRISLSFFILALLSLTAWYVAAGMMVDRLAAPINNLFKTIRQLEAGEEVDLDAVSLDGELRQIALAYFAIQESNQRNLRHLHQEQERQSLFFSRVTHQLKTPLTSVIGYSQIIDRLSDDEEIVESAAYIEQAGMNLLKIAEGMLEISKYRHSSYEFHPRWFRLDEMVRECLEFMAPRLAEKGIRVENRSHGGEVYFDRSCVCEVVLNILDNCILHSGCSRVTLTTTTLPVRLMVEDDGRGMEENQIQQIFEPFYRANRADVSGSGLGLAICREMMKGQGGDVTATSTPGKGICFTLYFQDKEQHHKRIGNMARRI